MPIKYLGPDEPQTNEVVSQYNGKVETASTAAGMGVVRNVFVSTVDPAAGDGKEGDLWVKYIG